MQSGRHRCLTAVRVSEQGLWLHGDSYPNEVAGEGRWSRPTRAARGYRVRQTEVKGFCEHRHPAHLLGSRESESSLEWKCKLFLAPTTSASAPSSSNITASGHGATAAEERSGFPGRLWDGVLAPGVPRVAAGQNPLAFVKELLLVESSAVRRPMSAIAAMVVVCAALNATGTRLAVWRLRGKQAHIQLGQQSGHMPPIWMGSCGWVLGNELVLGR